MSRNTKYTFLPCSLNPNIVFLSTCFELLEICHLNHVNLEDCVNKLLGNMCLFISLASGKQNIYIIKWEDVEDMVTKKKGYNDNKIIGKDLHVDTIH